MSDLEAGRPEAQVQIEEAPASETMSDPEAGRSDTEAQVQTQNEPASGSYDQPPDRIWSIYCTKADEYDKTLVEGWRDDMDGILIFAGLFSAVITAFILQSFKGLQPNPGDRTVTLLSEVVQQLAAISNGSQALALSPPPETVPFIPTLSILRTNILWFLSLSFSLITAFGAIMVKQWVRIYLEAIERTSATRTRARIRAYLFEGLQSFRIPLLVTSIPTLLHVALFLFFGGLYEFMRPINSVIARLVLAILFIASILYVAIAVLPIIYRNCPYNTPILTIITSGFRTLLKGFFYCVIFLFFAKTKQQKRGIWTKLTSEERKVRNHLSAEKAATTPSSARDSRDTAALYDLISTLKKASEVEPFIEDLPGFFRALDNEKCRKIDRAFPDRSFAMQLDAYFHSCSASAGMMSAEQGRRALLCLKAMCSFLNHLVSNERHTSWFPGDDLKTFLTNNTPAIARPARCVITAVMCHHFRALDSEYAGGDFYYSLPSLQSAIAQCKNLPETASAGMWEKLLQTLETYLKSYPEAMQHQKSIPEQVVAVVKDARLLALIDFLVALMDCPSIPREARDALPLVVKDCKPLSQDSGLQRLFVEKALQLRASNESETIPPSELIGYLSPVLEALTDLEAIDTAKKIRDRVRL